MLGEEDCAENCTVITGPGPGLCNYSISEGLFLRTSDNFGLEFTVSWKKLAL